MQTDCQDEKRTLGGRKLYEFNVPGSFGQVETRQRNGQGEAAGAGAARIDVEDAVVPVGPGVVGMAADDDLEAGSGGV